MEKFAFVPHYLLFFVITYKKDLAKRLIGYDLPSHLPPIQQFAKPGKGPSETIMQGNNQDLLTYKEHSPLNSPMRLSWPTTRPHPRKPFLIIPCQPCSPLSRMARARAASNHGALTPNPRRYHRSKSRRRKGIYLYGRVI